MYLAAIVAANISVTLIGPAASIPTSFLFIGLDLTARDSLHEQWRGKGLWWKMALLIASGSILSFVLNANTGRIALASFVAFACAGLADMVVYSVLGERARMVRINGSNVVSAGVDSIIFPALAFGFPLLVWVMIGDFIAKVAGGFFWSFILNGDHNEAQPVAPANS